MLITPVDRPAGSSVKSLDITFMAANAVGIVLYLVVGGWPTSDHPQMTGCPMSRF